MIELPLVALCLVASVYDGDTITCEGGTRLRLAGIDAPEIKCPRRRRPCAPGDPIASRDNLRRLVDEADGLIVYSLVDANLCRAGFQDRDPFGRPVVRVWVNGRELSAEQLAGGFAVEWRCDD